jgi:hypothetical protein
MEKTCRLNLRKLCCIWRNIKNDIVINNKIIELLSVTNKNLEKIISEKDFNERVFINMSHFFIRSIDSVCDQFNYTSEILSGNDPGGFLINKEFKEEN